ncbi:MAG: prepilin-type N-terminal cleavage/methylation domain-containing protein [Gammaproteobacteria bacterium]|nr:prepilin-type N-terminal cleavage/methylation domain-containing protein [Gammaproteobacteria bacterium]
MQIPSRIRGFSLIELMIVVTIIGILSMVAIPSYQNYTKRARFTEVIIAAEPFKIAVSLALQSGATLDTLTNGIQGIPSSPKATKNLANLTIQHGAIIATGTQAAGGATYILKPNTDGSDWTVSGTCLKEGLCEA